MYVCTSLCVLFVGWLFYLVLTADNRPVAHEGGEHYSEFTSFYSPVEGFVDEKDRTLSVHLNHLVTPGRALAAGWAVGAALGSGVCWKRAWPLAGLHLRTGVPRRY